MIKNLCLKIKNNYFDTLLSLYKTAKQCAKSHFFKKIVKIFQKEKELP